MYKCTVVRPSAMSFYAARADTIAKPKKYGPEVSLGHCVEGDGMFQEVKLTRRHVFGGTFWCTDK